jgi:hypothetical protein
VLGGSIATIVLAVLLLIPTLQNMYQLDFVHEADAPHEMMIYVQTTTAVNTVTDEIAQIDQKMYGGNHRIPIAVTDDATWPFAWYLRDYTDTCFGFPEKCSTNPDAYAVIIGSGSQLFQMQQQFSGSYQYHEYPMRTQWDQGYMPPPCQKSATNACGTPQPYVGVGPWLWLSYGDTPPPGAQFSLTRAASNIWQWWWTRKPFGGVDGAYDMGIFINSNVVNATGVKP